MRRPCLLLALAACAPIVRDDLGDACVVATGPDEVEGRVVVIGGETGPFDAACTLGLEGGGLRLRTSSTWERDDTPFSTELIARSARAACAATVDGFPVRVAFADLEVTLEADGHACFGDAPQELLLADERAR